MAGVYGKNPAYQTFLRTGDGDVDLPFVVAIIDGRQRRDRVHDEQRRVTDTIHHATKLSDPARDPGRGLVVNHDDCLEGVPWVRAQPRVQLRGRGAPAPIARHIVNREADSFCNVAPRDLREPARLEHQHPVAGRERIHQGRFAASSARGRIHDHRTTGLKDRANGFQNVQAQFRELGPPVVDGRTIHGPQHAIRNIRRAWDLKKVTAGVNHDWPDQRELAARCEWARIIAGARRRDA